MSIEGVAEARRTEHLQSAAQPKRPDRVWSTDLAAHAGERVRLAGWLHRLRRLSAVSFLILRDGRGLAQIVLDAPDEIAHLAALYPESVLEVTGTVVAEPQAPNGVEVRDASVRVLVPAISPPPFDLFRPQLNVPLPAILDHAPVALRHPRRRAFARLAAASVAGFRDVLLARGFVEIHTPKIVGAATE
jgi:nondiscriminating aspartyl-tRNA synthetase